MRPDFTTLKLFLSVVEEGSIGKAAEREHISATAISKRIIELEQSLGVSLLERHNIGVRLTPAGAALAVEVRELLSMLDRLRSRLSEYACGEQGRVRILFSPSGQLGSLPQALQSFLQLHPSLDVHLEERRAPQVVEAIAQGDADIGIVAQRAATGALALAHGVAIRPYESLRLVLVVPGAHPLAELDRVSFAEAVLYDFVLFSESSGLGSLLRRISEERGLELKGRLHVTTFDSARRMVEAGLGICVMCAPSVEPYASGLKLKCIALTDAWADYALAICTRRDEVLSKPARLMLAHLIEMARNVAGRGNA